MRFVAVNPARTSGRSSPRGLAWTTTAPLADDGPCAQATKSARFFRRSMAKAAPAMPTPPAQSGSGAQALAALGAATGEHLLSVFGGHAQAEAVTALAHESGRLIGPL